MDQISLEEILPKVEEITKEVGAFIYDQFGKVTKEQIESKAMNSLVSYVDKTAEEKIVKQLSVLIDNAGFITEEETVDQEIKDYTWIIDPLDGTTNFLYNIPHFSVSIALKHKEDIVIGVVYDVMKKELFSCFRGGGSFLNGHPISIGKHARLDEALVVTGFPYNKELAFKQSMQLMEYFLVHARGFRRLGSAALDLAYVAAGRLDIYYEATLNSWDVAAGILLIKESGGMVTDYAGENNSLEKGEIIASNSILHAQVHKLINHTFKSE